MDEYQATVIDHLNRMLGSKDIPLRNMDSIELNRVFDVARVQGVGATLFPMFNKNYKEYIDNNDEWKRKKHHFFDAALRNVMYLKQINELLQYFEGHHVSTIVLKGIAIARLYEHPQYRMMSDLDIYVRSDDWDNAKECLTKFGYVQTEADDYNILHIEFQKENAITVELHRNMINSDHLGDRDKEEWYKQLWDRRRKVTMLDMDFFAMSAEDEFVHQITHFAAHFVYDGTRLKHLFEMAIIIIASKQNFEWKYLENTLRTLGFYEFGALMLTACKRLFQVNNIPIQFLVDRGESADRFIEDLLNFYSYEKVEHDYKSWHRVAGFSKLKYSYLLYQPLIWTLIIKTQYNIHGFKLPFIINNSYRNIIIANKKFDVIRRYKLSGK